MTKASITILAVSLACAHHAVASTEELHRGDGLLDLGVGWATPGEELERFDARTAFGLHYHYHVTSRIGLGLGVEATSFDREQTFPFGGRPTTSREERDILSIGPSVRFVFNPLSRVRAYAGGGIDYNRIASESSTDGWSSRATEHKVGAVASSGFEMDLSRRILMGAELRYGHLNLETRSGRYTQATFALRLGYRF